MSNVPIFKLPIRHHYVLDADGHHPWRVGWPKSERVWYGELTAEEIVEELHAIAATIWQQAGIDLEIEAIEPLDLPEWYTFPATWLGHDTTPGDVHSALVGSVWDQGQPFLNVIWVRRYGGRVLGETFGGRYRLSDSGGWYAWVPGFGIVVESSVGGGNELRGDDVRNMGRVLAHEVGHALGLCHVYADYYYGIREADDEMAFCLSPFTDDVSPLTEFHAQRNLLSYFFLRSGESLSTIPSGGLDLSEIGLTPSQSLRARLTLIRRMGVFQAVGVRGYEEGVPVSFAELNGARESSGLTRLPVLPDCLPHVVLAALL